MPCQRLLLERPLERRKGGETGVLWVEATQGDGVWQALESGEISLKLLEGCLSRSHSLNMACGPHDRAWQLR